MQTVWLLSLAQGWTCLPSAVFGQIKGCFGARGLAGGLLHEEESWEAADRSSPGAECGCGNYPPARRPLGTASGLRTGLPVLCRVLPRKGKGAINRYGLDLGLGRGEKRPRRVLGSL